MGFAGARAANQDYVLGSIQELTAMQGLDGGLVDLAGGKIKPREVLVGWGEVDQKTVRGTVFPPNAAFMW